MRNEDVNTLTGHRIVDAPARLAQSTQSDAVTNMMHEVQTSWMSQTKGDTVTQFARNGINVGKCGAPLPPGWDATGDGLPKCLPSLNIETERQERQETQTGYPQKPHYPHTDIKPHFPNENRHGYGIPYDHDDYGHGGGMGSHGFPNENSKCGGEKPNFDKEFSKKKFDPYAPSLEMHDGYKRRLRMLEQYNNENPTAHRKSDSTASGGKSSKDGSAASRPKAHNLEPVAPLP
jgi:hypothetical protein